MSKSTKYMFAILALAVSACAHTDSDGPALPSSQVIMIDIAHGGIDIWQALPTSRAELPAPDNDEIQSVGVFAVNDKVQGLAFENLQFYNRDGDLVNGLPTSNLGNLIEDWPATNDWPYYPTMTWIPGANYVFVGYSPYSPEATVVESQDNDFSELVWRGLSSISAHDHIVSTCVPYTALASSNPAVPLELNHVMARLRFCFKMGSRYGQLRKIKVKKMEVNYSESRLMTLTVSYTKSSSGYVPTYRWQRDEPGTGASMAELRNEPGVESITLSEGVDYQALASLYYEPGDPLNIFTINVYYDVYDIHDNLLRENDQAISNITMYQTLEAGKYYDVKITIEPSYLYILSDQEPDSDGGLVIPDIP